LQAVVAMHYLKVRGSIVTKARYVISG